MTRTKHFVVKTNGDVFEEFQQFICGQILYSQIDKQIQVVYMTSEKFKVSFKEYFLFRYDEISIEHLSKSKYLYNPSEQNKYLQDLEYGHDVDYIVFEAKEEFRTPNCDLLTYIKDKSKIHRILMNSVHEYVYPQLNMLYSDDKLNVGLNYNMKDVSNVYSHCDVHMFNYIDFSNSGSMRKKGIEKYQIGDKMLLYIALSRSDFIIGDLGNIVNYESCMPRLSMVHDVSMNNKYDLVLPVQTVYHQTCLFPNSQMLLQYIHT